jgi:hypothetical protein
MDAMSLAVFSSSFVEARLFRREVDDAGQRQRDDRLVHHDLRRRLQARRPPS